MVTERSLSAHRADNERSVDLLLHAPGFGSTSKQTYQNVTAWEALLMEPPTRCQTERPEEPPSRREPCHKKSEGTGAAVG